MDAWSWVITAVLVAWFAVSAAAQLGVVIPIVRPLWDRDVLGLVPCYTFFAPKPLTVDYHLVMRIVAADGSPGPWAQVYGPPSRGWRAGLWNPGRRRYKAVCDVGDAVIKLASGDGVAPERMSVPYLLLLAAVTGAAATAGAPARARVQFLIAQAAPALDEPRPVYLSGRHRIGSGCAAE